MFAVLLESGLDGVRRKLDPGDPANENLYRMSSGLKRREWRNFGHSVTTWEHAMYFHA